MSKASFPLTNSLLFGDTQQKLVGWEEQWTGDYVLENEWQSFRTKKDRSLELVSVAHACPPGRHKIAVKVGTFSATAR